MIALTEGIENALAVHQSTGISAWAADSAHGMETFVPPAGIKQVDIWCDNDLGPKNVGQTAAAKLTFRLIHEGFRVRMMITPVEGTDWLDTMVSGVEQPHDAQKYALVCEPHSTMVLISDLSDLQSSDYFDQWI